MTAKPHQKKKKSKSDSWLVATVVGIALAITLGSLTAAFQSSNNQQLVRLQSEFFPSSQYQPIQLGSAERIAQQDFSRIDNFARQLNYSGTSVTELAELLAPEATTDTEKARMIYAWITQHVSYDVAAFIDAIENDRYPDVDAERVLRDRTTICSGYSNLYQALAEAMNLQSVIVVGYAKGATPEDTRFQDVNHAWNAVQLEDGWYLLDTTWGAGTVKERQFQAHYQPYYFATPPAELINHHFPQDKGWQLLPQTYTRASFDNSPNISARFHNLGLDLVDRHNYKIATAERVEIKLKAPSDIIALAHLKQDEQELIDNIVLVNRQSDNIVVSVAPPAPGVYDLSIYAKRQDEPGDYGEIIQYQITANNPTASLPKVYDHFNQYQASLIAPLTADLQPNWSTAFNLNVPQAIDVQVVNTNTQKWTPLNGYGTYFTGNVDIQSGNTVVVAKFPEDDRYWQLLEYQSP